MNEKDVTNNNSYDFIFGQPKVLEGYDIYFGIIGDTNTFPPVSGDLSLKFYQFKPKMVGVFNVNNPAEFLNKKENSFQETEHLLFLMAGGFKRGQINNAENLTHFQKGLPVNQDSESSFIAQVKYPVSESFKSRFQKASNFVESYTDVDLQNAEKLATATSNSMQRACPINTITYNTDLQKGSAVAYEVESYLQEGVDTEKTAKSYFNVANITAKYFDPRFQLAEELGNPLTKTEVIPPIIVKEKNNDIVFACLAKKWEQEPYNYTIVFNDTCELKTDQPTDYSEPIFVKNTFTLKNLETGQEIKATDLSFSTDVDSYAWTGSMTIPDNQVEFLKSPTNKAVLIEYIFNGIKAVFQVGKLSRNITFGQRSYKVKLSSPTIKLDEPISNVASYTNQNTLTPSAYAEKLIDPINSGITLIWDFLSPLEWVITKGAFTYQNLSPIKAVGSMLENSGAFISTSLDGKNLVVKRKRPVVFWGEVDLSKLITIPTGIITSLGYEIEHLQHFTGVYVLADDRTVFVRRRGTNGAILAPQIVANQLTSNQACVEAGRYVLANSGIVETHDLAKPILNDGVLLNPADVVKFVLDGVTYIGTVISTSIAIKFNSQYQTFKVEVIKGFN